MILTSLININRYINANINVAKAEISNVIVGEDGNIDSLLDSLSYEVEVPLELELV